MSCVANAGIDAQLRDLWSSFVQELPGDSSMLDLATGNGFVALKCRSSAQAVGKTLRIDAVDAAGIDPPAGQKKRGTAGRVRFQGGIQLERLPFDDGAFTAVVSQFGFEYADEAPAVAEASRVLAGKGHLCLVVHAKNTAVSRDIDWRLRRLEAVLAENGAAGRLLRLLRTFEQGDSEELQAESARLPVTMALIECLAEDAPADDSALFYANEFLRLWNTRHHHTSTELLRSAEQGWCDANDTAIRQKQMLNAARSEEDIGRICQRFESGGLNMEPPEKIIDYRRNIQNAWLIRGRKL